MGSQHSLGSSCNTQFKGGTKWSAGVEDGFRLWVMGSLADPCVQTKPGKSILPAGQRAMQGREVSSHQTF